MRSNITQSGLVGSELIGAEEYFNPGGPITNQHTLNTPVHTPITHSYQRPPNRLPVKDAGYLEPSPKSPPGPNKENHTPTGNPQYMDLLSDPVSQQGKFIVHKLF